MQYLRKIRFLSPFFLAPCLVVSMPWTANAQSANAPKPPESSKSEGIKKDSNGITPSAPSPIEPMVARVEMRLSIGDKEVDVIEKGDLLTVLEERENGYLIRTFRGIKGSVQKANAVKLAESVEVYDELIQQSPTVGRLYTLRAGASWARGNTEKALADFDRAIELGYDTANGYSCRGLFLSSLGRNEEAIRDFAIAIEKGDRSEAIFINRAAAYLQMNQVDDAIADYTAAIAINQSNAGVFQQRATAFKVKGDVDKAILDFSKAIELNPKFIPALMGRGYVYFETGEHELAIVDFTHVIALNEHASVAYNNRGYNYQQLGKSTESMRDYEKAIDLNPNYALAHQNLAWLLATAKEESIRNPAKAILAATRACELNQYNDLSDMAALAASHAAAKQFDIAIGLQEKIVERAPAEQKPLAQQLLDRYRKELPFDPDAPLDISDPKSGNGS